MKYIFFCAAYYCDSGAASNPRCALSREYFSCTESNRCLSLAAAGLIVLLPGEGNEEGRSSKIADEIAGAVEPAEGVKSIEPVR